MECVVHCQDKENMYVQCTHGVKVVFTLIRHNNKNNNNGHMLTSALVREKGPPGPKEKKCNFKQNVQGVQRALSPPQFLERGLGM